MVFWVFIQRLCFGCVFNGGVLGVFLKCCFGYVRSCESVGRCCSVAVVVIYFVVGLGVFVAEALWVCL